jgi:hypothetical protein
MVDWPASLPELPLSGKYTEMPPNLVIRTGMDVGPAKVRRRFTAGVRDIKVAFFLTADQVEILDDFFLVDLLGGSLSFTWVNPRTNSTASLRFKKPPNYSHFANIWYDVDFELEILP